jgi:hypothetical protein
MPASNSTTATLPRSRKPGRKYFSLDEANRALPYVSRIIEDIAAVYADVVDLRKRIEMPALEEHVETMEKQYERAMDRLSELVDELHVVGVELKDFEKGLIDFPAWHEDREVCLCWMRGEAKVEHWHEPDVGFAGRQPTASLDVRA